MDQSTYRAWHNLHESWAKHICLSCPWLELAAMVEANHCLKSCVHGTCQGACPLCEHRSALRNTDSHPENLELPAATARNGEGEWEDALMICSLCLEEGKWVPNITFPISSTPPQMFYCNKVVHWDTTGQSLEVSVKEDRKAGGGA